MLSTICYSPPLMLQQLIIFVTVDFCYNWKDSQEIKEERKEQGFLLLMFVSNKFPCFLVKFQIYLCFKLSVNCDANLCKE